MQDALGVVATLGSHCGKMLADASIVGDHQRSIDHVGFIALYSSRLTKGMYIVAAAVLPTKSEHLLEDNVCRSSPQHYGLWETASPLLRSFGSDLETSYLKCRVGWDMT